MNQEKIKHLVSDIRFWIVVLFAIRLIGITLDPLEAGHNWRQSLTNMITRNFVEGDVNLLYPKIDMAGENSGIIGSEFPFFNFIDFLWKSIFGSNHWSGRLINLLVSSVGLLYFYKIIASLKDKKAAFCSTIILGVSIWFAFSRKVMPDTFSVSLIIISLYHVINFINTGKWARLLLFFVFATLGGLCKIPAITLLAFLPLFLLTSKINQIQKISLSVVGLLSLSIIGLWYFHWVPKLVEEHHYPLFFPKTLSEGWMELKGHFGGIIKQFTFHALQSYLAFTAFLVGSFLLLFKSRSWMIPVGYGITFFVFLFFIIKTGAVFPTHNYYIIPFAPVMAFASGTLISKLPKSAIIVVLGIIAIEGILNQIHDFNLSEDKTHLSKLEETIQNIVPVTSLTIVNGGQSPTMMYFSHRKGWTFDDDFLTEERIDSLRGLGAEYLIVDRNLCPRKDARHIILEYMYTLELKDPDFYIYNITEDHSKLDHP